MKSKALIKKSTKELVNQAVELKKEIFSNKFKGKVGKLEKPHLVSQQKKDFARILTILNAKKINIDSEFHKLFHELKVQAIKDATDKKVSEITPDKNIKKNSEKKAAVAFKSTPLKPASPTKPKVTKKPTIKKAKVDLKPTTLKSASKTKTKVTKKVVNKKTSVKKKKIVKNPKQIKTIKKDKKG